MPGCACASLRVPSTASRGAAAAEGSSGPSSVRWRPSQGPALTATQSHAVGAGTWSPQAPGTGDCEHGDQRSSHRQPPPASLGHARPSAASGDWIILTYPSTLELCSAKMNNFRVLSYIPNYSDSKLISMSSPVVSLGLQR